MFIKFEAELLNEEIRKSVIHKIESQHNKNRKAESYRRHKCYKDSTKDYVIEHLLKQFDPITVQEMSYAISNISILKKVVSKLARVYSNGVERTIQGEGKEADNEKLNKIEKLLNIDSAMKKADRYLRLHNNVNVFVKPYPIYSADGLNITWGVGLEVLAPHHFDVICNEYNKAQPLVVVLSDYEPQAVGAPTLEARAADMRALSNVAPIKPINGPVSSNVVPTSTTPSHVAPMPTKKTYVFWSKNYHFTCDENGTIISSDKNPEHLNPLKTFNHILFSRDNDGQYWSESGDALTDGAILINSVLSHTNNVGITQSYGQFYATGSKIPRQIKLGMTHSIIVEYDKDEQAKPELGFLNANPQLDSLRSLIEMFTALYLTTNNLSTSGVATQLNGSSSAASGVALIIDKAESLEDVQDQRQGFLDKEPSLIVAINSVLKAYQTQLNEDFKDLLLPEDFEKSLSVKFFDPTPIMSEDEKLKNLTSRLELGLESMVTVLMKDDPSLSRELAEEKLKTLLQDRIKFKLEAMATNEDEETIEQDEDVETEDTTEQDVKTPTVGDSASNENVQQLALNGAQVTALVEIVEKVASGVLPRESALNMIVTAFNVLPQDAEKILGSAGKGFKVEAVKDESNIEDGQ